jgi:S-DNA-T family DNA segregation ATPase FtsK/SpoIIIE
MNRTEQRWQVARGCVILLVLIVCAFLWIAILSFDQGDYPSPHAWPNPVPSNNAAGRLGAWVAYKLFLYFGYGTYAAIAGLTVAIAVLARQGRLPSLWQRVLGVGLLITVTSISAHLLTENQAARWPELRGGVVGRIIGGWLNQSLNWMTWPILLYCAFVGLIFTAEGVMLKIPGALRRRREQIQEMAENAREYLPEMPRLSAVTEPIRRALISLGRLAPRLAGETAGGTAVAPPRSAVRINPGRRTREPESDTATAEKPAKPEKAAVKPAEKPTAAPAESAQPAATAKPAAVQDVAPVSTPTPPVAADDDEDDEDLNAEPLTPEPKMVVKVAAPPKLVPTTAAVVPPRPYPTELAAWEFPPVALLQEPEYTFSAQQEEAVRDKARILEQTLTEFRIEAKVVEIDTGPVITMFELQVAAGVKVSQIASLANDIARSLRAPSVRVVSPIPGKTTVGIEVPNTDKEKVRIKELMTVAGLNLQKMNLPLFLGKDASGNALVTDLTAMPHLLIAGTTGSGKSVCINSIIMSVLMTQRPDMVKLILIDPKMVEMSLFKDVPHLMCPIVTEMDRAEKILEWATEKMDERYALLAEAGVRNIAGYNRLTREEKEARFQPTTEEERAQIPLHLPYIVIMIDELADMMMLSAKEVELHLSRLAQKSRAVGIHIIVATQRPEARIVTGLIKSNLPCRIAFRVASRMDSRIVLDQNGAEVLMGSGDMLYLPPGSSKLVRAQGTYLEDSELKTVINFLTERGKPEFHPELMQLRNAGASIDGPRDELFDQAVEVMLQTKRGSVSLLQRRLAIGYSRASRLIEEMAAAGIVGEYKGSQAREVLISAEEWQAMRQAEADRIRTAAFDGDGVPDDLFDDDID